MVGVLLLGRWPAGLPAAWPDGEARPWPTQQEIREAKDRARGGGGYTGGARAGERIASRRPSSPATSARKKRKRRVTAALPSSALTEPQALPSPVCWER